MNPSHLLDTSTFIWAVDSPKKLSRAARRICSDADPGVSVVSLMELIIKAQKGRIKLAPDPVRWWNHNIRELGLSVIPLRQTHMEALWALPPIHQDPADRLLIAQAMVEGIPLVTCDEIIPQYPVVVAW